MLSKEHEAEIVRMLKEDNCTDSAFEDYCDEHNLSEKEVFHFIATYLAPEHCRTCEHVDMHPDMYPCNHCLHASNCKDMYSKRKD